MIMLPLLTAQHMGIRVGRDPKVAMTTGGVVFVADRSWDEACTREASAMVDWDGDELLAPPFQLKAED